MNDFLHIYIESKNIRECKYYWHYLKTNNFVLPDEPNDPVEYSQKINDAINSNSANIEENKKAVEVMIKAEKDSLLPSSELKPLDKKIERMCYWAWCYCRLFDKTLFDWDDQPRVNPNVTAGNSIYLKYKLNENPTMAEERYHLIIKFLDFSTAGLDSKRKLLAFWQKAWGDVYAIETFSWLDNKELLQCEWAYKYLLNDDEYNIPTWFLPLPTTCQQYYDTTIAAFDIWGATHPDSKRLFIIKMKKAWSQKKHRDNMVGKKAYNFVLRDNVKDMLDAIAENSGLKKNQCLEKIIEKEFKLLKS